MTQGGDVLDVLGGGVVLSTEVHGGGIGGGALFRAGGLGLHLRGDGGLHGLLVLAGGAGEGGGGALAVLGPGKGGLAIGVTQGGDVLDVLGGGVVLSTEVHGGGIGGGALFRAGGLGLHLRGDGGLHGLLILAGATDEGGAGALAVLRPGKGGLAVAMRLKHRGNGHIALGHGEFVLGDGNRVALYLPLLEVVALGGLSRQGHFRARGSIGDVGRSGAAGGGVDGDGVGGLLQADVQLVQLGRFGVRSGEHQGAGSGLGDHQVEGDGAGFVLLVVHLGSSRHVAGLDLVAAPSQLIGGGAAAVGSGDGIGARHRGIVIVSNGILLVKAVEEFPMAGPATGGHLEIPFAIGVKLHIVELAKLRFQGGGDVGLAGEYKGILGGVLIPLHQVSLGNLDGLFGCGQSLGGGISLSQYGLGVGNGLRVVTPAALVPLTQLSIGLIDQSLDLLFGHFRSGNHRTGAADLL